MVYKQPGPKSRLSARRGEATRRDVSPLSLCLSPLAMTVLLGVLLSLSDGDGGASGGGGCGCLCWWRFGDLPESKGRYFMWRHRKVEKAPGCGRERSLLVNL